MQASGGRGGGGRKRRHDPGWPRDTLEEELPSPCTPSRVLLGAANDKLSPRCCMRGGALLRVRRRRKHSCRLFSPLESPPAPPSPSRQHPWPPAPAEAGRQRQQARRALLLATALGWPAGDSKFYAEKKELSLPSCVSDITYRVVLSKKYFGSSILCHGAFGFREPPCARGRCDGLLFMGRGRGNSTRARKRWVRCMPCIA